MTDRRTAAASLVANLGVDAAPDKIFVRDLILSCAIGAYEEEKGVTQKVSFTVEAAVTPHDGTIGDDLANVPSYDGIIEIIRGETSGGHINLVETLAERIASHCLENSRIASVMVRIEKLERGPRAVGVEIVRPRASAS